jgi:branched-subunit amino acid aminotransferase/4-amino-4-deoxychorismate lyase
MEIAKEAGIPLEERRLSLVEFQAADEVFTTGTMGELSHVIELDGRQIGDGALGPVTSQLQARYAQKTSREGVEIPR